MFDRRQMLLTGAAAMTLPPTLAGCRARRDPKASG